MVSKTLFVCVVFVCLIGLAPVLPALAAGDRPLFLRPRLGGFIVYENGLFSRTDIGNVLQCGKEGVYESKAFLQFDLSNVDYAIEYAVFGIRTYYGFISNGIPEGEAHLEYIEDVGSSLDESDWNLSTRLNLRVLADDLYDGRKWRYVNVTDLVIDAINNGKETVSFRIVSTDNDSDGDTCLYRFFPSDSDRSPFLYVRGRPDVQNVVVAFDDGYAEHTMYCAQILNDRDLKGTFFPIFILLNRSESIAQPWLNLQSQGHEIGSHSYGHPNMYSLSAQELKLQTTDTYQMYSDLGFDAVSYAVPGGTNNVTVNEAILAGGFKNIRVNNYTQVVFIAGRDGSDNIGQNGGSVDDTTDVEDFRNYVEMACDNYVPILLYHKISEVVFLEQMEYLYLNGIQAVRLRDAVDFAESSEATNFSLSIRVEGQGGVDPPVGTYVYAENTLIHAIAIETNTSWVFNNWTLNSNTLIGNPLSFLMNENKTVIANFVEKNINGTITQHYDLLIRTKNALSKNPLPLATVTVSNETWHTTLESDLAGYCLPLQLSEGYYEIKGQCEDFEESVLQLTLTEDRYVKLYLAPESSIQTASDVQPHIIVSGLIACLVSGLLLRRLRFN